MNSFADLVRAARSCRRFDESSPVTAATLRGMVDVVRLVSSCVNRQPLRYITASSPEARARVFPHLKWAAALKWEGPQPGERPTGYILICGARPASKFVYYDTAIAGQTMQLHATAQGLGCCMINNFAPGPVREALAVPETLEPLLVLAFGRPAETRRIEDAENPDKLSYWRDEDGVHHVPKLTLGQVLVGER